LLASIERPCTALRVHLGCNSEREKSENFRASELSPSEKAEAEHAKVFCFFFSKKKSLPLSALAQKATCTATTRLGLQPGPGWAISQ